MRIGIILSQDHPETTPRRYVKKSVAALLCRRLLCEWVTKNVIRELVVNAAQPSDPMRFAGPELPLTVADPVHQHPTGEVSPPQGLLVYYPIPNYETTPRVLLLARTTAS